MKGASQPLVWPERIHSLEASRDGFGSWSSLARRGFQTLQITFCGNMCWKHYNPEWTFAGRDICAWVYIPTQKHLKKNLASPLLACIIQDFPLSPAPLKAVSCSTQWYYTRVCADSLGCETAHSPAQEIALLDMPRTGWPGPRRRPNAASDWEKWATNASSGRLP